MMRMIIEKYRAIPDKRDNLVFPFSFMLSLTLRIEVDAIKYVKVKSHTRVVNDKVVKVRFIK